MITVLETTKWDGNYDNHQYILSDDKQWMYGFIRAGEKYPKLFNNPIGFNARGRTFTLILQTKDVSGEKQTWHITGSKGDVYTVSRRDNNWKCSCPAAMFRGKTCKHVEEVQRSLDQ